MSDTNQTANVTLYFEFPDDLQVKEILFSEVIKSLEKNYLGLPVTQHIKNSSLKLFSVYKNPWVYK